MASSIIGAMSVHLLQRTIAAFEDELTPHCLSR